MCDLAHQAHTVELIQDVTANRFFSAEFGVRLKQIYLRKVHSTVMKKLVAQLVL